MNAKTRAYVQEKVRTSEYASEADVYAAIEALKREEEALAALRREIDIGIADLQAGRFTRETPIEIGDAVKREMMRR